MVSRRLVTIASGPLLMWALFSGSVAAREVKSLDFGWRFHRGDVGTQEKPAASASADPSRPDYDDRGWNAVNVPDDYVIKGTFRKGDSDFLTHGALPLDVGWYRRRIDFPASAAGKIAWLDFEGVYRNSQYWLDGKKIGSHKSGFIGYHIDLGPVQPEQHSELAVRVDPSKPEGWWYDGGGIYRHVRLVLVDPIHVAHFGVFVRPQVEKMTDRSRGTASVEVSTDIENQSAATASIEVVQEVIDGAGKVVATEKSLLKVAVGSAKESQTLSLKNATLWSCDHPALYTLRTTLREGERVLDEVNTPFGVREIRFDPNGGLFLNGQHVVIKGVCYHQDAAGVGSAVPDRLGAWRLEQLKSVGVNAVRSHHALSPEFLDDCDRMGVLVLDEFRQLGDRYDKATPETVSGDLHNQAEQVKRDRNHPSVILWSLCNEEFNVQGRPEGAKLASTLKGLVDRLDGTRPVTAALVYQTKLSKGQDVYSKEGILGVVDVIGFNYGIENWDRIHAENPEKPCVVTELTRMMNTRGVYAQEKVGKKEKGIAALGLCNQYSDVAEESWKAVASRPWLAGVFVWVGFDFRGEPKPVAWPPVMAQKGIFDYCGFKKDSTYYYQSWWTEKPTIHVFPHWNWKRKEGQEIPVWVYSNAKTVELFLNGHSLGKKPMPRNGHLEWSVKYEPGTLEARGDWEGKMRSDTVTTTGAPARIVLEPDRTVLKADGEDLSVVTVKVVDAEGRVVPTADNLVHFQVTGAGSVLGVGNGNPASHEPDKADQRSAFAGLCQALVQTKRAPGKIVVQAEADGLQGASVTLEAK